MEIENLFYHASMVVLRRVERYWDEGIMEYGLSEHQIQWWHGQEGVPGSIFIPCFEFDQLKADAGKYKAEEGDPSMKGWQMSLVAIHSVDHFARTKFKMLQEKVRVKEFSGAFDISGTAIDYGLYYSQEIAYYEALMVLPHLLTWEESIALELARQYLPAYHELDLSPLAPPEMAGWWQSEEIIQTKLHELGEKRKVWIREGTERKFPNVST